MESAITLNNLSILMEALFEEGMDATQLRENCAESIQDIQEEFGGDLVDAVESNIRDMVHNGNNPYEEILNTSELFHIIYLENPIIYQELLSQVAHQISLYLECISDEDDE